jgi:simple sugar transport system permease protein
LQRRLDMPDASVLVLQGFAFLLILASDALRGRLFTPAAEPAPFATPVVATPAPEPTPPAQPTSIPSVLPTRSGDTMAVHPTLSPGLTPKEAM